jgi:cytochrome c2
VHDDPRSGAPGSHARGGAGLYDAPDRRPSNQWLGAVLGLGSILLTLAVGVTLYAANPAFGSGAAAGTRDQIGQLPGSKSAAAELQPPEPGTPAAEGRAVIAQKGCTGCHVIPGFNAGANVGPSLAGVGSRTSIAGGAVQVQGVEDLARWVLNPPALKPGTAMPATGLAEDEAAKVAAYLERLK